MNNNYHNCWVLIPLFLSALDKLLLRAILQLQWWSSNNGNKSIHPSTTTKIGVKSASYAAAAALFYFVPIVIWFWILGHNTSIGTVVVWQLLTMLLSKWPRLLLLPPPGERSNHHDGSDNNQLSSGTTTSRKTLLCQFVVHGGPLGTGCAKLIEVLTATLVWKMFRGTLPISVVATVNVGSVLRLSSIATVAQMTIVIVVLSLIVNVVLYLWSKYYSQQRHNHSGLHTHLRPTMGRTLSVYEHIQLIVLAVINAICEEFTSRGFWRSEFELTAGLSPAQSNMAQSILFGAWHYYGIPSGWSGVVLTTIYGWIMGALADYYSYDGTHGPSNLIVPIIVHSIADYYIFAVVARANTRAHKAKK